MIPSGVKDQARKILKKVDKENKRLQEDLSKGKEVEVGNKKPGGMTRKDFLNWAVTGVGGVVLAACGTGVDATAATLITPDTFNNEPVASVVTKDAPTITVSPEKTEIPVPTEIQGEYGDFESWPDQTKEIVINFNEDPTKVSMEQLEILQSDIEALRAKDHREGLISLTEAGMFFGIDKRLTSLWRYVNFAQGEGKEQVVSKQEIMYATPFEIIWMTTNKDMIIPSWWVNNLGQMTRYGILGLPEKYLPDGSINPEYDKQLKERLSHQIGPSEIDHYLGQNETLFRRDYDQADGDLALMATLDPRKKDSAIALIHMRDEKGEKHSLFPLFVNFTPMTIPEGTPFGSFYGYEWLRTPSEMTMEASQTFGGKKHSLVDYFSSMGKYVSFQNVRIEFPGMSKIYDDLYGPGYHADIVYGVLHPVYHIEMAGPGSVSRREQNQMWSWEKAEPITSQTP
jgi:hypothetical protein